MVKRTFREHRFAFTLIGINTLIIVEEVARLYLTHPKFVGLGWYWTAVLSLPCSILWYFVIEWFPSDVLRMVALVLVGAFQWGIVGSALDYCSRPQNSSMK